MAETVSLKHKLKVGDRVLYDSDVAGVVLAIDGDRAWCKWLGTDYYTLKLVDLVRVPEYGGDWRSR